MTAFIPEDYGGFAPRFFGVTVRVHSEEDFALLEAYITDRPGKHDERSLKSISLKSVLDHETRHFHDFLISPYGGFAFRCKLQAAVHGLGLMGILKEVPGDWLPTPLVAWCAMDENVREQYLDEWRAALGDSFSVPQLPDVRQIDFSSLGDFAEIDLERSKPDAALAILIETVRRSYSRLQELTQGMVIEPGSAELTPCNFFEVLALAAQVQAIWRGQSADCALIFLKMLEGSDAAYAKLWRRILALASRLPNPHASDESPSVIDQMVAIVMWCTFGNFKIDNIRACPNFRFLLLENFLKNNGGDEDLVYNADLLWQRWDAALSVPTWRHGIEGAAASNKAHAERLSRIRSDAITSIASEILKVFCRDQEKCLQQFFKNPNLLVRQELYVESSVEAGLPVPSVRFESSGFKIPCPSGGSWAPMWDDSPVSQVVLRRGGDADGFVLQSVNLERMIQLSDLVMAGQEPPRGLSRFARDDIQSFVRKKPIWIV